MMNELDFRRLCAAAGTLMELPDPEGFGHGERTDISGVPTEIYLDDDMPNRAILVLEVGTVKVEHKAEAYEALLALQGMLHATHDCAFDYDGIDDAVLLRTVLPISGDTGANDLASVINLFVTQITLWREGLLAGWLVGLDTGIHKSRPSATDMTSMFLA